MGDKSEVEDDGGVDTRGGGGGSETKGGGKGVGGRWKEEGEMENCSRAAGYGAGAKEVLERMLPSGPRGGTGTLEP